MIKVKKELEDYLNLVIPQPLEENEYIRLLMISTKTEIPKVLYLKTFEEVSEAIKKHIFYCNIFISLATYLKKGADEPEIYRRQVIFLDFDKKDFPDFEELSQYSNLIKSKFPSLFYHCVVASGSGGYHYYISLEPAPLEDIVKINKDIAKIVGADIKAANSKQIVRIPTSNNLKDMNNKKYVKVVANTYGTEKFIPYTTERLKNMVQFCSHKNEIVVPKQEPPIIKDDFTENFYCVEQMINLGCKA